MYVLLCPFCSLGEASPAQLLKCTSFPVECCKEAGNVSTAPQGESPLSHTMEGWAGPEKAEGWITAWSPPMKLPQPSPHRHCCSCRHPVSTSHPRTSLCPPAAGFHTAPCWAPSPGKERISLRSWSTSVGVVWTPVKEGSRLVTTSWQQSCLYLLSKVHP